MSTFDTGSSGQTQHDRRGDTMPWEIRKEDDDRYCVYKRGGSEPLGCYRTEGEARRYQETLYGRGAVKAATEALAEALPDLLIGFGDAVKALPEGRLRGRVVRFTDADNLDLSGEFFTKGTDFGLALPAQVGLYYHHGFDPTLGKRRLGRAEVKAEDDGLWFEAQLDLADRYQARIYQLAQAGKLGASSGAVKHLVEKVAAGHGAELKAWPLGEVSVTPSPVEPLCNVMALKAWLDEAPSFEDLCAGLPAAKASLAENTELWLDRGEDLMGRFRRLGEAETKAGRPQFSAARVERMLRMHELLTELLHECGGMPQETEPPAPGMGAMLEGEFLATLARQNGVSVDAPSPPLGAGA